MWYFSDSGTVILPDSHHLGFENQRTRLDQTANTGSSLHVSNWGLMTIFDRLRETDLEWNAPSERSLPNILARTSLMDLYAIGDGWRSSQLSMRFLSLEEAQHVTELVRKAGRYFIDDSLLCFDDDESNYCGVYLVGPLAGKVHFLDHEEPDPSPTHRNLESFLSVLLSFEGDFRFEGPRDYPLPKDAADLNLALHLLQAPRPEVREGDLLSGMALLPATHAEHLVPAVSNSDPWIQEKAISLLGEAEFQPAADLIFNAMDASTHNNVRIAGLKALGKMKRADLVERMTNLGPGWAAYISAALQNCGLEDHLRTRVAHSRRSPMARAARLRSRARPDRSASTSASIS